ncbi:MAG: glycoside hydrolase family 3 N-terminal domain-containing protein [Thermoanaerobaculum sp.]
MTAHPWLVCGVAGLELSPEERELLEELQPGGVILFARNIASPGQVRELVAAVRSLPGKPYVAVDLEGGRVNRLRSLVGELPSPQLLAQHGEVAARELGEVCGALCAVLGIHVDLAPVVDVAGARSYIGGEERCWGDGIREVVRLGKAFLEGLETFGVRGCLKHFPGLGSGDVDSHRELPVLADEVKGQREVFSALAAPHRAVMVAHALAPALGEALAPASCSPRIVGLVPKNSGPILADDLEMGALEPWGSLGERAAAALLAGCHQVLLCNALEARREVAEYVDFWAPRDPQLGFRLAAAKKKLASFAEGELARVSWEEALERVEELRARWGGG